METKKCSRCQQVLDVNKFGKNRYKPDGLKTYCKKCRAEYAKEKAYTWPSRTREKKKAYTLATIRRAGRDKSKDTKIERDARYRENNKEKITARAQTYWRHRKAQECSMDGCSRTGERHHLSYDEPDNFIWLCRSHHIDEHVEHKQYFCVVKDDSPEMEVSAR